MDHEIHHAPERLVDVCVVYYCDSERRSLTCEVILEMADLIEASDIALRRPPVPAGLEVRPVQPLVLDDEDRLDHETAAPELFGQHARRDVDALDDDRRALVARAL